MSEKIKQLKPVKLQMLDNENIVIPLQNFGYLSLAPLARTSDIQNYDVKLKLNGVMAISGMSLSSVDFNILLKEKIIDVLVNIEETVINIRKEIMKNGLK